MKKTAIFLVVSMFILNIFLPNGTVTYADEGQSSQASGSVVVSAYNEKSEEYILNNTQITIGSSATVESVVKQAAEESGSNVSFEIANGACTEAVASIGGEAVHIFEDSTYKFRVRINGKYSDIANFSTAVSVGDIIEILYTSVTESEIQTETASSEEKQNVESVNSRLWSNEISKALQSGCDWLEKSDGADEYYLLATGAAGVTANTQKINDLVYRARIASGEKSVAQWAIQVIMLSFCGYDDSDIYLSNSLKALQEASDMEDNLIEGKIYTLLAYDMRSYSLSSGAANSREKVISLLLGFQLPNGAFTANKTSNQESMLYTAKAITALVGYSDLPKVKTAIDNGMNYIKQNIASKEYSTKELAEVVIAFCSNKTDISEIKTIGNVPLLQALLARQQTDGGFSESETDYTTNSNSTEIAVIALAAIKKDSTPYRITQTAQGIDLSEVGEHMEIDNSTKYIVLISLAIALVAAVAIIITIVVKKKLAKKDEAGK